MKLVTTGKDLIIEDTGPFSLSQTLDCGQCFQWEPVGEDGYEGVAGGRYLRLTQLENGVLLHDTSREQAEAFWLDYFDLSRDYAALQSLLSRDETLCRAIGYAGGLRVLRQPAWEAVTAFIISQNNNIKRIKGIVKRLCAAFGAEVAPGWHAFPEPQTLAALSEQQLRDIGTGFRARYLIDAARKVADGEIDLAALAAADADSARRALMGITGVGDKVSDCICLYGLAHVDCVPRDVWMKRALATYYPDGMPPCAGGVQGLAQQYLFHYIRHNHN